MQPAGGLVSTVSLNPQAIMDGIRMICHFGVICGFSNNQFILSSESSVLLSVADLYGESCLGIYVGFLLGKASWLTISLSLIFQLLYPLTF